MEKINQELEQYLRFFINYRQEQWLDWLGTAEFAYNNKIHSATKVFSFKANYGQDPRMGFEERRKGKFEIVGKFVKRIKKIQRDKSSIRKSTRENKKIYRQEARRRGEV